MNHRLDGGHALASLIRTTLLLGAAVISGCGGGGEDSPAPSETPPPAAALPAPPDADAPAPPIGADVPAPPSDSDTSDPSEPTGDPPVHEPGGEPPQASNPIGGGDPSSPLLPGPPSTPPPSTPSPSVPPPSPAPENTAPTITGTPQSTVRQGDPYAFTPSTTDADGDALVFEIANKPSWATFDASTGTLHGTPQASDVGIHPNIVISVSDGAAIALLPAFTVDVVATASGALTLHWRTPVENADGTPLLDLVGYRVYWGRAVGNYPNSVTLRNSGLTTYVVEELTPGTWYFTVTALSAAGEESQHSNVASEDVL